MSWRKRYANRLLKPVAGFLLALIVLEAAQTLPFVNLFPAWNTVAEAAYNFIQPDGDGTITGTPTTCGASTSSSCLDDGVATSSSPSTAGDYITFSDGNSDNYTMQTLSSVNTVSKINVPVYHRDTGTNMNLSVSLWDAAETTQYGTTQNFGSRSISGWDTANFTGLSLTQTQLDGLKVRLTCTRSGGKPNNCIAYSAFAAVTYTEQIDVTVSSIGNQQDLEIATTSAFVGGTFVIAENTSSRSITGITINETGSVDAQNHLDNIKLYYEYDTSNPYDCSGMTYNGGGAETQFGSTDTDGFSGANGSSAFSGSASINTTQAMCVYVVLDVTSGATPGQDLEIQITDPTTDVVGSGSPIISPSTPVLLPNTTTLRKPVIKQENYHWRNDDGDETDAGATSATGGSENTSYDTMPKGVTKRLRFAVSNEGNATSTALQLRLEYATKTASCAAVSSWVNVGDTGKAFYMFDTGNLTNGNDTTSGVSVASGGVSDPNTTFLTPNGGIRDTTSQTGNIVLKDTEFVELEYAFRATTTISDGTTYCFRVSNAGTPLDGYTNYAEATIAADVLVDSIGSQNTPVVIPTTGQYAGGAFRVTDSTVGAGTISSITITAAGTVDAQNDISNIKLRYDLDTSDPYTCDDVSYANTDTQYGSTAANFNGSNQAVFTGSVSNSPTQTVCLYVEYNVEDTASNGETLELSISNPSTELVIAGSSVAPTSPVGISGTTILAAPYVFQSDYHWRNNDGNEGGASSATGGTKNTLLAEFPKSATKRLRFSVGNTGLSSAPETRYRLEWGQKVTTCSAITEPNWERIDTAADEWQMSPTVNLTEGNDTTDIAESIGGVGNPATSFLSNNNGVNDTTDLTSSSTLLADNYLDLEYSISATTNAVQGATYCFRVTAAGTPLDGYTNYAEATIKLDTDFKIQRGATTSAADTLTLVAGRDYEAPSSASNAFIRITNTQLTGAGPNTGNSSSNADDVTVYITNPSNILTSVTFARGTGAAGNTRITWEIIEYTGVPGGENEIIVRRQEPVSYIAGNTTVSGTVTNTISDNNDVVIFITGQRNLDAGKNNYHQGLSTAAWNTTNNQADFTRNASGVVSDVSYALVEFTGANWKVQRLSHTYTTAGAVETGSITAVNSLARTFLHVQKRTSSSYHEDFGHEVWLSGIGQVSFLIDPGASTPSGHTSVAWVIENTQTLGATMDVHRSNGLLTFTVGGPLTNSIDIGPTINDLSITSLFVNNRSDEAQRSWPEPILGAMLASTTHYELWQSDTSANINYRTEVVEWPTAARKLEQNYYRLYVDNDAILPTDPWPAGAPNLGENAEMTALDGPMVTGDKVRIRMTLKVTSAAMPATLDSFKLQYAKRVTTCSAISSWSNLGDPGSTTAKWRGVNNTPADGTALSGDPPTGGDLLITSVATVAGTYEEQNNTALNPYLALPGDEVEYDWVVQDNGADDKSSYCFRMTEADGSELNKYNFYPVLRTVGYDPRITNWRWYDDETNPTPSSDLGLENIAPINIANQNAIKLRLVLKESSGAQGVNVKFAVQFSEYADFSQAVKTVVATSSCVEDSLWCYYDGAGIDNDQITSAVISDADPCVAGVGSGCGTYNESTSTIGATFDQAAFTSAEYEFTLLQAGARANAVYYFRLYDLVNDEIVQLDGGSSYPSLVVEGPQLVSTLSSVSSGTSVAGIVTDVNTTPTSIGFGTIPLGSSYEAAQRLSVTTNATEGYQLLMYATQQLTNSYGDSIPPISATNAVPAGWGDPTGCTAAATGCFGYHTTDATLEGGSGRFGPIDSYAALDTVPQEIMYSSIPAADVHDIVYRIQVGGLQPAGDYQTSIIYMTIPVY